MIVALTDTLTASAAEDEKTLKDNINMALIAFSARTHRSAVAKVTFTDGTAFDLAAVEWPA